MKLKCRIHEKDYDIVSGATFSEEYNETLDSGSIILDHIDKIYNLKPYDDVFIWNAYDENGNPVNFNGYYNFGDKYKMPELDESTCSVTLEEGTPAFDWVTKKSYPTVGITFTSHSPEMAGKIIDLWYSMMFGGDFNADKYSLANSKIVFRLLYTERNTQRQHYGYYKFPMTQDGIIHYGENNENEALILELDDDFDMYNYEALPGKLVVLGLERTNDHTGNLETDKEINFNRLAYIVDGEVTPDFERDGTPVYFYDILLPEDFNYFEYEENVDYYIGRGWETKNSSIYATILGTVGPIMCGPIIDLWILKVVMNSLVNERWEILSPKITLKIQFQNSIGNTYYGYYKLPMSNSGISNGMVQLELDNDYDNSHAIDGTLFIRFFVENNYASNDGEKMVVFSYDGIILRSANSQDTITITHIGVPEDVEQYETDYDVGYYTYKEHIGAISKIEVSLPQMDYLDALNIQGLKISGITYKNEKMLGIGEVSLQIKEIIFEDETHITIVFFYNYKEPLRTVTYLLELPFEQQNDGTWYSNSLAKLINTKDNSFCWLDSANENIGENAYMLINKPQRNLPKFYKHLLVDSFTCDMVDFDDASQQAGKAINYKYKINLMSETKRLEKIILPNISITQPIVGQKRTIWYYLNQYVNLYSPKIKKVDFENEEHWIYENKYKIDQRMFFDDSYDDEYTKVPVRTIFDDTIYAPEMSLTAPSLRDVLSKLMIVKDCIPIVKNDVIYAMKISQRHGEFITDGKAFSFITESMNSSNYSTAFRREYGNAISQKNSTHMVEYLGFRNYENALMTMDNMYLETRFPIYKINSLYMYYYKTVNIHNTIEDRDYKKLILVRQDISKLVLQNTVRDALPADWTNLPNGSWSDLTTEEMSKYRLLTLGYDIGSNRITGWGEKYSYIGDLLGWTRVTNTYIETIMNLLDRWKIYGDSGLQFLEEGEEIDAGSGNDWQHTMVSPSDTTTADEWLDGQSNITNKLKTIFFKMDYIGMYSGAIIHSKENTEDDDIQTSDNCSSALSILEVDGLFEKEKANRLGNAETSFIARYNSIEEMNETYNNILGAVYDDDIIIFHKEYQIYDDCVLANFVGSYDYVMKNYFTTVFAKYRTYSYASYSESVNRTENDKYIVVLSDDSCVYEEETNANELLKITSILSGFSESYINQESLKVYFPNQVNGGFFKFSNGEFFSDVNSFVSGYSLCFNIKTFGTITNGNCITSINCYENSSKNVYIGSTQDWYIMPISETDGFVQEIGCYFSHFDDDSIVKNNEKWTETDENVKELYKKILALPIKDRQQTFSFGKQYNLCKDEKEIIDFTLQYELVNQDKDLLVSEWLMKLTDFNNYVKFSNDKKIIDSESSKLSIQVLFASKFVNWNLGYFAMGSLRYGNTYSRQLLVLIPENLEEYLTENRYFDRCQNNDAYWTGITPPAPGSVTVMWFLYMRLYRIKEVIRSGGNISKLKIQIFYSESATALQAVTDTEVASGVSTITLEFNKTTEHVPQGYLGFIHEGQDIPSSDSLEGYVVNTYYNNHSLDSPEKVYGSLVVDEKFISFPQTMYIFWSERKLEKGLVYEQYDLNNLPSYMHIVNTSSEGGVLFQDIFSIQQDEYGRPFIQFKANEILGDTYQSVQYWYYDANGDKYLHFVFGLNRTKEQGDGKAYISIVKNRNKTVYNFFHRAIAHVTNCADSENASTYGQQCYEEDE